MGDDLEIGNAVEQLGKDHPSHRRRGLIGPAEGPPDLVFGPFLGHVVGEFFGPRRVQEDRLAHRSHVLEEGEELGQVEWLAVDVGVDLYGDRAEILDGAPRFLHHGVGIVDRRSGDEAGEAVGMFGAQIRHRVGTDTAQFSRVLRRADDLQRRGGQRQYLHIVLAEHVHDLETAVEVGDHGNVDHPARNLLHRSELVAQRIKERLRPDVVENTDLLHCSDAILFDLRRDNRGHAFTAKSTMPAARQAQRRTSPALPVNATTLAAASAAANARR